VSIKLAPVSRKDDGLWRMVRQAVVRRPPQAVTGFGGQKIAAGFKDRTQISPKKIK